MDLVIAGETCIPAHKKVTVRSKAEIPEGFGQYRPCCNSTNGVRWTLQSDAGASEQCQSLCKQVRPSQRLRQLSHVGARSNTFFAWNPRRDFQACQQQAQREVLVKQSTTSITPHHAGFRV